LFTTYSLQNHCHSFARSCVLCAAKVSAILLTAAALGFTYRAKVNDISMNSSWSVKKLVPKKNRQPDELSSEVEPVVEIKESSSETIDEALLDSSRF
jgi:hypothetical protein